MDIVLLENGDSPVCVRKALIEEGARPTVADRHGNRRTSPVMSTVRKQRTMLH